MEPSIAEFLMWYSACELLPTTGEGTWRARRFAFNSVRGGNDADKEVCQSDAGSSSARVLNGAAP